MSDTEERTVQTKTTIQDALVKSIEITHGHDNGEEVLAEVLGYEWEALLEMAKLSAVAAMQVAKNGLDEGQDEFEALRAAFVTAFVQGFETGVIWDRGDA